MKHITRILVLPFFLMYALSPLYLSAANDGADFGSIQPSFPTVSVGMVWLSFLMDSIEPEQETPARGIQTVKAEQNDEMILIKKKRVLGREIYKLDPVIQVVTEPVQIENQVSPAFAFDIPRDLIHNHSKGYHSLNTGLSPPSLLS